MPYRIQMPDGTQRDLRLVVTKENKGGSTDFEVPLEYDIDRFLSEAIALASARQFEKRKNIANMLPIDESMADKLIIKINRVILIDDQSRKLPKNYQKYEEIIRKGMRDMEDDVITLILNDYLPQVMEEIKAVFQEKLESINADIQKTPNA